MQIKRIASGLALATAVAVTPTAFAGVTGNIGVTSEYFFRGVTQGNGGAAVQGGLDTEFGAGFYAGTWMSNLSGGAQDTGFGNVEVDIYGGWAGDLGGVSVDVGVLEYWYPTVGAGGEVSPNTLEFYASAGLGPVSLLVAYTPDYFGADDTNTTLDTEALYLNLSGSFPLSETLSLDAAVGMTSGDGVQNVGAGKDANSDSYVDFSLGLSKDLGEGMSFGMAWIGNNIENSTLGRGAIVGSFGYEFDL